MTKNIRVTQTELEAISERLDATMAEISKRSEQNGADEDSLWRELYKEQHLATWRALHVLAAHIDYLRVTSVQGEWVGDDQVTPPPTYNT